MPPAVSAPTFTDPIGGRLVRMNVLIIEPGFSGHLLVFVRILIDYALEQGATVTVALGKGAQESMQFELHLEPYIDRVAFVETPVTLSPQASQQLINAVGADFAVVPHADRLATQFGLLKRPITVPLSLLIMRDPRWETPTTLVRRLLVWFKLILIKRAERVSNLRVVWLREQKYVATDNSLYAIDPFIADESIDKIYELSRELKVRLALSDETFWFGVTGHITSRKNVGKIVTALRNLRQLEPERQVGLALLGPISQSAKSEIDAAISECKGNSIPCVVYDQHISNLEMNVIVAAVDCIVMAYDSHSPNSTMVKCYALGTHLVVAAPPSVQAFARKLGFNYVSNLDSEQLSNSMRAVLAAKKRAAGSDIVVESDFAAQVFGPLLDQPQ